MINSSILWFSIYFLIIVNSSALCEELNNLEKISETVQINTNLLIPPLEFLDKKKFLKWEKSVNENSTNSDLIFNNDDNEKIKKNILFFSESSNAKCLCHTKKNWRQVLIVLDPTQLK